MKADERKRLILEHAKRLFSRKGYYNTQISDIVDEAKIARGTVYQYFKNKDDIFITLIRDFYNDWEKKVSFEMNRINLGQISPQEYFYFRVKNTLEFLADDPDLCNIVLRMGIGLSGELESTIKRFEKKIHNLIVSDLELGIRNNHIRKDLGVEMASNLITGALLKTALYDFGAKKRKKDSEEIEQMAREILNIFAPAIFIKK
ncbi:MAG: TetR/AcrR family transcriptional regulator [Spirochaetes bacterium]|nr:TetR/AcrR family transcriptional regulator [Spirochaetota bacterium]HOD14886.1 TetR/AcrR family transcriptional regulator [Spirochaetota bacterium]HPG49310.1 TetR/AcrR family transcriptional regulator [Spirochaetota bacterium]